MSAFVAGTPDLLGVVAFLNHYAAIHLCGV